MMTSSAFEAHTGVRLEVDEILGGCPGIEKSGVLVGDFAEGAAVSLCR
jgi:hypothetical protein